MTDFRIGHGYDVHALADGLPLVLGGIEIPHTKGFVAHSDGDVAIHAVCDASFRMGNLDSAQYQPQAVRQRMHVVSVSYPEIGHMLSVFLRKDNRTGM